MIGKQIRIEFFLSRFGAHFYYSQTVSESLLSNSLRRYISLDHYIGVHVTKLKYLKKSMASVTHYNTDPARSLQFVITY